MRRPTSSRMLASSRLELNSVFISARTRILGETRGATGIGPFVSWCFGRNLRSLRIYTGDKT